MDPKQQESSYADRLAAMSLLRENLFYNDPQKYAITDIAEDLPGAARPLGQIIKNVLPSKAIISSDPEERKKQISDAVNRIKASRGSTENLGKEITNNVVSAGLGSIPIGFSVAALFHLLGPRGFKSRGLLGALKGKTQAPITPLRNLGKLFSRKGYAKTIAKKSLGDALQGAGWAAAGGVAYPILNHMTQVSDKSLAEAQKVMEEQPYITSLPTSEMLSVIKERTGEQGDGVANRLKNIMLGTGVGAATNAVGGALPSAMQLALNMGKNVAAKRPITSNIVNPALLTQLRKNVRNSAMFGGALGGLSGAFTNNLIDDEYKNYSNQT